MLFDIKFSLLQIGENVVKNNKTGKKEASKLRTSSTEFEWTIPKIVSYIVFLYKQNERTWEAYQSLGNEIDQVKAELRGEY